MDAHGKTVVYTVGQGVVENGETGRVREVPYSAISHIVYDVKEGMKKNTQIGKKAESINSQFKM